MALAYSPEDQSPDIDLSEIKALGAKSCDVLKNTLLDGRNLVGGVVFLDDIADLDARDAIAKIADRMGILSDTEVDMAKISPGIRAAIEGAIDPVGHFDFGFEPDEL